MSQKKKRVDRLEQIEKRIKFAFLTVKEELNEHLDSINDNTDEIQANYEYSCEIDSKISKLAEQNEHLVLENEFLKQEIDYLKDKIDKMEPVLAQLSKAIADSEQKIELSQIEKKLFMVLYTAGEGVLVSLRKISERLDVSEKSAGALIADLNDKGIPIIKKTIEDKSYFELEKRFKDAQAKERLIEISPEMYQEFN